MKTFSLISLLALGAMLAAGGQADTVLAGGAQMGFQSSFSQNSGLKGRIGVGNLQSRIRSQQGFNDSRNSVQRGSVRQGSGSSGLTQHLIIPPNALRQRLQTNTQKMQKDLFAPQTGQAPHQGNFDLKQNGHSGNKAFAGPGFKHRRPRHSGLGSRGRLPGPILSVGPFYTAVLPLGYGVFQTTVGTSTNVTAFPGHSDFSQRILDQTQGNSFRNSIRAQTQAWSNLEANGFDPSEGTSGKAPHRSHRQLKRMKNGKPVFSDYGGRIIGDDAPVSQSRPSPFTLR